MQYSLVVELVFPDNPDGDLRLMKKLRLTTFTVNKTWIEMLFVFVDWHTICIVFRQMLKKIRCSCLVANIILKIKCNLIATPYTSHKCSNCNQHLNSIKFTKSSCPFATPFKKNGYQHNQLAKLMLQMYFLTYTKPENWCTRKKSLYFLQQPNCKSAYDLLWTDSSPADKLKACRFCAT